MRKRLLAAILVLAVTTVSSSAGLPISVSAASPGAPTGLMTELLANPELTTITDLKPEFSWIVNDTDQNEIQTAYQVLVASSLTNLNANNGNLWDSGRVTSSESSCVEYNGSSLANGSTYYWKVRTWDKDNNASPYSVHQQFNTVKPSEQFIKCADNGGSFTLPGTSDVAFGANGRYYYLYGVSGTITFNSATFGGDPVLFAAKEGYYRYPSTGKPMETPDRYPITTEEIAPVSIINKGNGNYFIDFGRDAFADLKLTLTSTNGGETINIRTGEQKLSGQNAINMNPVGNIYIESNISHWEGNITLAAGTKTYTVGDYYKYPFRYVEINGYSGTVNSSTIKQISYFYPSSETAASFSSNNTRLNQIWELCKYSMKPTSWCGVYVDGVREHTPYEADAYINQLSDYSTDREYSLGHYSIQYLMAHPTWPSDWTPQMPLMADAEYMYTGNKDNLAVYYEALKTSSHINKQDSTNLLPKSAIGEPLVDWMGNNGYNNNGDYIAVSNAFYYKDLKLMEKFATVLGKSSEATTYRNKAANTSTAYNNTFFNTGQGLYIDSTGISQRPVSPYGNAFSAAFGMIPENYKGSVRAFLDSFPTLIAHQYGAQYVLEGMYELNLDNKALKFMTDDENWMSMITAGSTITTEFFPGKNNGGDWNHAWGAAPANLIPRYLMGVQPIEPAFAKMQIKPQTGDLTNASLTLPTIRGQVQVSVTKSSSLYTIGVNIPANTKAKVYVRKYNTAGSVVKVDGVDQTGTEEGDFIVFDNVGSGSHTFQRIVTNISTPAGPAGYAYCANEDGTYTLPGTCDVAYGANGNYLYLNNKTGNITFNYDTFGGDPALFTPKAGFFKLSGITGYTQCANENETYTLPGTYDVAYGANGSYYFLYNQTGNITFNNTTFGGDPAPNVAKKGYYRISGPAGYTWCAAEDATFALSGTCDVAYGSNGQFNYLNSKTGNITFNNTTFGDPNFGVAKAGFVKVH
ncbi:MAG: family 78 glycoside hydrolase catalytic domain [Mobilitalea sp.]